MSTKVGSFLFTLAIIAWEVIDIIHGRITVFTWIALGFFSLVGLFELGAIFDEKNKNANKAMSKDTAETPTGIETETATTNENDITAANEIADDVKQEENFYQAA